MYILENYNKAIIYICDNLLVYKSYIRSVDLMFSEMLLISFILLMLFYLMLLTFPEHLSIKMCVFTYFALAVLWPFYQFVVKPFNKLPSTIITNYDWYIFNLYLIPNVITLEHFQIHLPELLMLILFVFSIISCIRSKSYYGDTFIIQSNFIVMFNLSLIFFFIYLNYLSFYKGLGNIVIFNLSYSWTQNIIFCKILILILMSILTIFSSSFFIKSSKIFLEYPSLLIITTFFLFIILSSLDLFIIFLCLESLTFITIILILLSEFQKNIALEAGLKYFYLSIISATFILLSISLLQGIFGSTNLLVLKNVLKGISSVHILTHINIFILSFIMALLFIGFFFKLTIFPGHMWAPDVYEGLSWPVLFYIGIIFKIVLLFIIIKLIMITFFHVSYTWNFIVWFCSFLSILIGTLGALIQNKIKKFIAYSSITHLGYILINLSVNTYWGIVVSIGYILIYFYTSVFFILLVSNIQSYSYRNVYYFSDLKNIFFYNKKFAFILAIVLLSFAGLPPTLGFFAKYWVFYNLVKSKYYFTTIILLINTLLSTFYYLKLIKHIFFYDYTKNKKKATLIIPHVKSKFLDIADYLCWITGTTEPGMRTFKYINFSSFIISFNSFTFWVIIIPFIWVINFNQLYNLLLNNLFLYYF